MKIAAALLVGLILGLAISHLSGPIIEHIGGQESFAQLHANRNVADSSLNESSVESSPAINLMQTDTALCDQPYFIELYELTTTYFSAGTEIVDAEAFSKIVFDHARESGHFTAEEAENWISHIKNIPTQSVEIYKEDSTAFDSCYKFQVAAVGPPA